VGSIGRHSQQALAPYLNPSPVTDHGAFTDGAFTDGAFTDGAAGPADVVDRLLWRDAQEVMTRHEPDGEGHCHWCGRSWPCTPRRCAERADVASRAPWTDAWTARHDLYSLRTMPDRGVDRVLRRPHGGWHRLNSNRGPF
jgi:hypothetical protein